MRTRRALVGVDLGHTGQEVLRVFLGKEVVRWHVQGGIDLVWSGTEIRTLQVLPGHSDVATTMIYTHVLEVAAGATSSPLDAIGLGS
jgi:integrase